MPIGYLSDVFGRKWIFIGTLFVLICACLGFLFARSLNELYIYMFMMGLTFPGRIIVGANYAYEFLPDKTRVYVQPLGQYAQGASLILTAFYF